MSSSFGMLFMTVYGRQETRADKPDGWSQGLDSNMPGEAIRLDGRPISQWSRIAAGRSDDLGTTPTADTGHRHHWQFGPVGGRS